MNVSGQANVNEQEINVQAHAAFVGPFFHGHLPCNGSSISTSSIFGSQVEKWISFLLCALPLPMPPPLSSLFLHCSFLRSFHFYLSLSRARSLLFSFSVVGSVTFFGLSLYKFYVFHSHKQTKQKQRQHTRSMHSLCVSVVFVFDISYFSGVYSIIRNKMGKLI